MASLSRASAAQSSCCVGATLCSPRRRQTPGRAARFHYPLTRRRRVGSANLNRGKGGEWQPKGAPEYSLRNWDWNDAAKPLATVTKYRPVGACDLMASGRALLTRARDRNIVGSERTRHLASGGIAPAWRTL